MLLDVVSEVIEPLLSGGGLPAPESIEGQRRARLVAAITALAAILAAGQHLFGGALPIAFVTAGSIAAIWVLAFSMVDLAKECPPVRWQSVAALAFTSAGLLAASAHMLGAV
jgi:hypothetical protein